MALLPFPPSPASGPTHFSFCLTHATNPHPSRVHSPSVTRVPFVRWTVLLYGLFPLCTLFLGPCSAASPSRVCKPVLAFCKLLSAAQISIPEFQAHLLPLSGDTHLDVPGGIHLLPSQIGISFDDCQDPRILGGGKRKRRNQKPGAWSPLFPPSIQG